MNATREAIRRQLELEDEGRAIGAKRYQSRDLPWKTDGGTIEEEANLPPGRRLLKVLIEPTKEVIEQFLADACSGKAGRRHAAADFLLLSDPQEAAYLTGRVLINSSASFTSLQNTAVAVADAIIENLEYKAFKGVNKDGYKGFMKAQEKRGYSRQRRAAVKKLFDSEGVKLEVETREKVLVGTKLIEMVCEATGLFQTEKTPRSKGYIYVVRPTEALQKWLDEQHASCALLNPVMMPMVVRPRRWRSPTYGGYLTRKPGLRLIKQRNKAYHQELANMDLSRVYNSVNHIQDTAWAINREVLDVMHTLWESGGEIGGLPRKEPEEIPEKPWDIDTNPEAKAQWKREAGHAYSRNAQLVSTRIAMHQRLWIARKFADEAAIYFPHELDFRGRVYPMPTALTPQGDDLSKGLLKFSVGKPLGEKGAVWLAIHLANLFGIDKVSFEERLKWTWGNSNAILAVADNPYDNRFWTEADSPFCALAACFEWKGYIEQGDDFVSSIPIALDGSCSGLQHFSAMLRDPIGGKAVNLTVSEKPQDVYKEVAACAQEIADATPTITYTIKNGEGEETDVTIPNPWANLLVTRTIAKRPTMTYCYSATRFGMQGMILQTVRELDKENERQGKPPYLGGADNYHSAMWLSHVIWDAISDVVVAASAAMEWLREAAKIAAEGEYPLWWTTPMGMPILQEYKEQKGKVVRAHWAGQMVDLTINVEQSVLSKRAQANGVAPNFVHSLDASHLMAVAERGRERDIYHLAVIHDSFGTHAADTDMLASILRETFVEQYRPDVLGRFYEELKEQLPEEIAARLPRPPSQGTLDLNEVLGSAYIFA